MGQYQVDSKLEFNEEEHIYRLNGTIIPSVTQALEVITDFSKVDPTVLKKAQELGTAVHKTTELYDRGTLDLNSVHDKVAPYLYAYIDFLEDSDYQIEGIEEIIYSKKYKYAGMLDRRGRFPRTTAKTSTDVLDLKTVAQMGPSVGPQVAAYGNGILEQKEFRKVSLYGLQLKGNGSYKLHKYKDEEWHRYFSTFVSCLNIYNYMGK